MWIVIHYRASFAFTIQQLVEELALEIPKMCRLSEKLVGINNKSLWLVIFI